jgi:putative pyoverdin transport system ATP-binding/permease protein
VKLFGLFVQCSPNRVFFSIVLGALAGVCYAFLVPLVLVGLRGSPDVAASDDTVVFLGFEIYQHKLAAVFFLMCLFVLVTRSISQTTLLRVATEATTELRKMIYERIARAPIADLEQIGAPKLIAAIGTDVARIVFGARMFPDLLISAVTVVGMLGFLAYLNYSVFIFILQAIAFGMVTYQIPVFFANRYFHKSRQRMDSLQSAIHGLIHGAKELKLDTHKRGRYFSDVLLDNEYAVLRADKAGNTIIRLTANYGEMISFFVIGAVAYVFINYHEISATELTGVVMAMLYITTPIALVLNTVPAVVLARISLRKVNSIIQSIPEEACGEPGAHVPDWNVIRVRSLCYQHHSSGDEPGFQIGPIDLDIHKGAVTFIVGGNGSGKSTLSKLLTLHYGARGGDIYFGDQKLTAENLAAYRQRIGAIYSDYFLFDRLLCVERPGEPARIEEYLALLRLENKLAVSGRKFSTSALSDGQRKRLALLAALLDDKEFYVFDEWAADQDPEFKEIFYRRIIHELKAAGKAVVVISHDQRYFNEADRLVFMEEGRVREILDQKPVASSIERTVEIA